MNRILGFFVFLVAVLDVASLDFCGRRKPPRSDYGTLMVLVTELGVSDDEPYLDYLDRIVIGTNYKHGDVINSEEILNLVDTHGEYSICGFCKHSYYDLSNIVYDIEFPYTLSNEDTIGYFEGFRNIWIIQVIVEKNVEE